MKISIKKFIIAALIAASVVTIAYCFASTSLAATYSDQREYAHGMNFVTNPATGKSYLIWSDQYATGSTSDGNWTHDVYYQEINTSNPKITKKKTLISAKEAQEPASVAVSPEGNFFVTFEDGANTHGNILAQNYAVFDKDWNAIKAYPQTIAAGGHSGHASSTSNKFVTFWNNDWVDGGGVDNLGTGKDVYVTSMNTNGTNKKTIAVAKGKTRNWWPLLAASSNRSLLVWQRYVNKKLYTHLCYAIYNPTTNRLCSISGSSSKIQVLKGIKAKYYCYNVVYLPEINRYVINITTSANKGTLLLLNSKGRIIAKKTGLPAFVRESTPAVKYNDAAYTLCYPRSTTGAFTVTVNSSSISYKGKLSGSYKWTYCGTSGFFTDDGSTACFATLPIAKTLKSNTTVKLINFKISN